MTFEEAEEFIISCQEQEEQNPGLYETSDGLGVMVNLLRRLKATYAPKIKMTSEQKEQFMEFVDSPDDKFENFWFCLGSGDSLYKNKISEDDLMRAWLNTELIEVTDE